jgi:hypothetical protein
VCWRGQLDKDFRTKDFKANDTLLKELNILLQKYLKKSSTTDKEYNELQEYILNYNNVK